MMEVREAALAQCASAAKNSGCGVSAKNVICRVLCLDRGQNHQTAIITESLE
jgi:hypothetical protein